MHKSEIFFTSTLVGGEWSAPCSGLFTLGKQLSRIHWIGGCADPRASLDVEIRETLLLMGLELRLLDRTARRKSQY
jgi:hypothetical protein